MFLLIQFVFIIYRAFPMFQPAVKTCYPVFGKSCFYLYQVLKVLKTQKFQMHTRTDRVIQRVLYHCLKPVFSPKAWVFTTGLGREGLGRRRPGQAEDWVNHCTRVGFVICVYFQKNQISNFKIYKLHFISLKKNLILIKFSSRINGEGSLQSFIFRNQWANVGDCGSLLHGWHLRG